MRVKNFIASKADLKGKLSSTLPELRDFSPQPFLSQESTRKWVSDHQNDCELYLHKANIYIQI